MGEINRKRLKELLKIPENNMCADCQDPGILMLLLLHYLMDI